MLIRKHDSAVEPPEDASLRLDELVSAINAAARVLTLVDARAIWHELNTVADAHAARIGQQRQQRADLLVQRGDDADRAVGLGGRGVHAGGLDIKEDAIVAAIRPAPQRSHVLRGLVHRRVAIRAQPIEPLRHRPPNLRCRTLGASAVERRRWRVFDAELTTPNRCRPRAGGDPVTLTTLDSRFRGSDADWAELS